MFFSHIIVLRSPLLCFLVLYLQQLVPLSLNSLLLLLESFQFIFPLVLLDSAYLKHRLSLIHIWWCSSWIHLRHFQFRTAFLCCNWNSKLNLGIRVFVQRVVKVFILLSLSHLITVTLREATFFTLLEGEVLLVWLSLLRRELLIRALPALVILQLIL